MSGIGSIRGDQILVLGILNSPIRISGIGDTNL